MACATCGETDHETERHVDVLWELPDRMGRGRDLFVQGPIAGDIEVSVAGVYTKRLDPAEARAMAAALIAAAEAQERTSPS